MKKQNQFKLIWLIPVVIIAATAVTVVIFGLSSKGVSGTPGYKVELDFNFPPTVECDEGEVWNYCKDSRNPELSWNYDDPEKDPQESYWLQIDNNSDFSSPIIDTGWADSSGSTYQPPDEILDFNTPSGLGEYYWQIKVKDSAGRESEWCSPSCEFTTPKHAYPDPWFEWLPSEPPALEPVEFTDTTEFSEGSIPESQLWSWDFSDDPGADPSWSDLQNPTATPSVQGEWDVILTVTDDVGTCSETIRVDVIKPLPEWEEVEPK